MWFLQYPHTRPTDEGGGFGEYSIIPLHQIQIRARVLQSLYRNAFGIHGICDDLSLHGSYLRSAARSTREGTAYHVALVIGGGRELAGMADISLVSDAPTIGIWIAPGYQGKGVGSQFYRYMLDWTRRHTLSQSVMHVLEPSNERSRHLAMRYGGVKLPVETPEGYHIYRVPLGGVSHTMMLTK